MKRIHDSLSRIFHQHRLVFWYDPDKQWYSAFEGFAQEGINKIKVEGNEFGTKVAIHKNLTPHAQYLLYFPSPRPADSENWLLDLLLQAHEYKADRASLALQEAGLTYDLHYLVEEHIEFFKAPKRIETFKLMLKGECDPVFLRLKMMAVMAGTDPDIDLLLHCFIKKALNQSVFDPVEECFDSANLLEPFWSAVGLAFGYVSEQPSVRDFVTTLFRSSNPLDSGITLDSHARVFIQNWKESQINVSSYRSWAEILEADLHIASQLDTLQDIKPIESADTFPAFDKFIINWICQAFVKEVSASNLLTSIKLRRSSVWYEQDRDGYDALEQAIILRELIASAELSIDSPESGVSRYIATWHKIDMTYRSYCFHNRKYKHVAVMEKVTELVEKIYLNKYLLPLSDLWSDKIRNMTTWSCSALQKQTDFFSQFVQPYLDKGQKLFVIISDALRFEAAVDFANRFQTENRWSAEPEAVFGSLPSYTQLGMASLLPGQERIVNWGDGVVEVDGKSATGTEARNKILLAALPGRATAVVADAFLEMNTKTEARALMRDNDVIYIFHNVIDRTADSVTSEVKTSEAVERAFDELDKILKKIASANGTHMLLTADHGFLFQQSELSVKDDLPLPVSSEWIYKDRRFAIGKGIKSNPDIKIFNAVQLGQVGDWQAAFPLSLYRFPLQGSGKRYVHGGLSLQEIVVPVIRIHKTRSDDTEYVEIEILRVPDRITTGQISLSLYQDRPASGKVLPRTLRIGVYAPDNTLLSETKSMTLDSSDEEPRHREKVFVLTMSRAADDYNNKEVEIRLEVTVPGTTQTVLYKKQITKLIKPFGSDFDEF